MSNTNEKRTDDDEFIKNLDTEYPLSGGENEDDTDEGEETEEETDEEFTKHIDTEFPLSGGETDEDLDKALE